MPKMKLPKDATGFSVGGQELEAVRVKGALVVDVPDEFVATAIEHGLTSAEAAPAKKEEPAGGSAGE